MPAMYALALATDDAENSSVGNEHQRERSQATDTEQTAMSLRVICTFAEHVIAADPNRLFPIACIE